MVHTNKVKETLPPFPPLPLKSGKEKELFLKKTYTTQSYLPSRNLPTYVTTYHRNR